MSELGYIYAVECGGRIKIGHSKKPEHRFAKIASDAPFPCVLLGYWPGSVADELSIHAKFNEIRVHGEWFASTEKLLSFIAGLVGVHSSRKQSRSPAPIPSREAWVDSVKDPSIAGLITMTHTEIIDKWPSLSAFADDVGVQYGTAKAMRRRGSIPPEYWMNMVAKAAERSIEGVSLEVLAAAVSKMSEAAE